METERALGALEAMLFWTERCELPLTPVNWLVAEPVSNEPVP